MRMQEFCQKTGYTKRTIHFYIKEGLLHPAFGSNGYYDFSEEEVKRLALIHMLRFARLSIPVIRSIMNTPDTIGLYLNQHIKELKQEQQHLKEIINGISRLFELLPLNPDVDNLYPLCSQIHIPEAPAKHTKELFDTNDNTQVNRFLWSIFLPKTPFTEYQEFLWEKLNRLVDSPYNENCQKISRFLQSLSTADIERLFSKKDRHINYIASLDHDGCRRYAEEMKKRIAAFLENEENIDIWKKYYKLYIYPEVQIYDSDICPIMLEMSPLFAAYCKNIHGSCTQVYRWLQQDPDGIKLCGRLFDALKEDIDLIHSQYGELELLANFRQLILGDGWPH